MKRHRTAWTPLISGLVFIGLAAMFVLDSADQVTLDLRWVPATLLVGIGLAIVAGERGRRVDPIEPPPTEVSRRSPPEPQTR
jgi:hypothetical protein